MKRYPKMQVQDLYKLLHQAALGNGHAVPDEATARNSLAAEMKIMGEGPDEPLLDIISPEGSLSRLHLRPCFQAGINPNFILTAFLQTANKWDGSIQLLRSYGTAAAQLAETDKWEMKRFVIENYFATMEAQGFPVTHHSVVYREHYHPAYRVVKTDIWRHYESIYLTP